MYFVHDLNPIAFQVGDFVLPWYWLVYVVGFFTVYFLSNYLIREQSINIRKEDLSDFMVVSWFALLIGGRLFYVVAYNIEYFLSQPEEIFKIWKGGMSFHGGMLGVIASCLWLSYKRGVRFFNIVDLLATSTPLILGFGRIANFINGELAGRVTQVPWAVIFPKFYDHQPRHPSQLYQAATEGFLLFAILWINRKSISSPGKQSSLFLAGYGVMRFITEFFRNPDAQLGFYGTYFTMGQLLCVGMILAAVVVRYRDPIIGFLYKVRNSS